MINKTVTCVLLFFLALSVAPTSAASETVVPSDRADAFPAGTVPVADQLLLATSGGKNWPCLGVVAGLTVAALVVGAATGSVGLALIGAYAPIAVVACA